MFVSKVELGHLDKNDIKGIGIKWKRAWQKYARQRQVKELCWHASTYSSQAIAAKLCCTDVGCLLRTMQHAITIRVLHNRFLETRIRRA